MRTRWVTHTEIVDFEGKDIVQRLDDAWELVGLQWHPVMFNGLLEEVFESEDEIT